MRGPRNFRYRHALCMLREIVEALEYDDFLRIVDSALDGDPWSEMQCGGAIAAAMTVLRHADAVERGMAITPPVAPQGTPQ